jgi:hypothetical protein
MKGSGGRVNVMTGMMVFSIRVFFCIAWYGIG